MKTRLALMLCVVGAFAHAQSPGTFTATGNMTTARSGHTATLLLDGWVLIAGGTSSGSIPALASAELYDPVTGTFVATGSMTTPRFGHMATLLPNGKVLITGGVGGMGASYSLAAVAELYDPSTGTFAATGTLVEHGGATGTLLILNATATLLNNGKVLISVGIRTIGAIPPARGFGAWLELYDPATSRFALAGVVSGAFFDSATLLGDGRVLLTSRDPVEDRVSHAQIYDPSTGALVPTGDATSGHSGPTGTMLLNGKVLLAGGDQGDGDGGAPNAELYDPATGTFSGTGSLVTGREQHTATLLPDGTVLFAGGHWDLPNAELYNPANGTFWYFGDMITGREIFRATLLSDGRVLITGGDTYDPRLAPSADHPITSKAELYTPPVLIPEPVLFSLSGDGWGQGVVWHAQTGQIASGDNPAVAGEALSMYTTSLADVGVIPPQIAIGGRLAEVLYFGASGYQGYNHVNFRVPSGVATGPAVPVRLTYLGRPSNAVTIGVQ